jgi:hypothetical protein
MSSKLITTFLFLSCILCANASSIKYENDNIEYTLSKNSRFYNNNKWIKLVAPTVNNKLKTILHKEMCKDIDVIDKESMGTVNVRVQDNDMDIEWDFSNEHSSSSGHVSTNNFNNEKSLHFTLLMELNDKEVSFISELCVDNKNMNMHGSYDFGICEEVKNNSFKWSMEDLDDNSVEVRLDDNLGYYSVKCETNMLSVDDILSQVYMMIMNSMN